MTEIQNSKQIVGPSDIRLSFDMFGYWNLGFGYYLEFEYCDLGFYRRMLESNSLFSDSIRAIFDISLVES
jgi:hypothetical protein